MIICVFRSLRFGSMCSIPNKNCNRGMFPTLCANFSGGVWFGDLHYYARATLKISKSKNHDFRY